MANKQAKRMTLSVDRVFQIFLLLIAIIAVKPNEVNSIRELIDISTTNIYLLMFLTIIMYFIAKNKVSSELLSLTFIVLLFLLNKLFRIIFLNELNFYDFEIGFIIFFATLIIVDQIKKQNMVIDLLSAYITLTAALIIFVWFQDPSLYNKFNEVANEHNYPFTPIGMNKNTFSLILVTAVMSCATIIKLKINKFKYIFLLIIFSAIIFFLRTRSHLPLLCAIWIWLIWDPKKHWDLIALIIIGFILAATLLLFNDSSNLIYLKESDFIRYTLVETSLKAFLENPFIGKGEVLRLEQQQILSTSDHNQFTLFLGYFGVLGLLAVVFFVWFVFKSFWGMGPINCLLLSSSFLFALSFTPFIYNLGCLIYDD